ncbi:hypothetical protein AKO1_008279 [Acrasis kona]|uniref:Uncharacterized protein n=1 Tax=Acrasis kona TaxID=1008807 RepID=A0AAW2YPE8_9EUKA
MEFQSKMKNTPSFDVCIRNKCSAKDEPMTALGMSTSEYNSVIMAIDCNMTINSLEQNFTTVQEDLSELIEFKEEETNFTKFEFRSETMDELILVGLKQEQEFLSKALQSEQKELRRTSQDYTNALSQKRKRSCDYTPRKLMKIDVSIDDFFVEE